MRPYSASAPKATIANLDDHKPANPRGLFLHDRRPFDRAAIDEWRLNIRKQPAETIEVRTASIEERLEAGLAEADGRVAAVLTKFNRTFDLVALIEIDKSHAHRINKGATGNYGATEDLIEHIARDVNMHDDKVVVPYRTFRRLKDRWDERQLDIKLADWAVNYDPPQALAVANGFSSRVKRFSVTAASEASLAPRPWLVPGSLLRTDLTQLIAPGAVGKSLLTLQMAAAIALNRKDVAGLDEIREQTKILVINLEDTLDEQQRRLAAICKHFNLDRDAVANGVLLYDVGDDDFKVATRAADRIVEGEIVDEIVDFAIANDVGLIIFDPLIETHDVNENANSEMKVVTAILRKIARRTRAAVMFVHHTRKFDGASSEGHAGNMDSGRGASSLPYATRVTQTLYMMTREEAKSFKEARDNHTRYCRLDDAKTNFSLASSKSKWFRKETVRLDNGDELGVLVPVRLGRSAEDATMMRDLFTLIRERDEAGDPITAAIRGNKGPAFLLAAGDKTKKQMLERLLVVMEQGGIVRREGDDEGGFVWSPVASGIELEAYLA